MRVEHLTARGFRNLAHLARAVPPSGVALLGANGQGKTNLLEAVCYPVLYRSFRGAPDAELVGFGGPGFHVGVTGTDETGAEFAVVATYHAAARKKVVSVDGEERPRVTTAVGRFLAVAFLPADVTLASGAAAPRRQYLDRMLALADPRYLAALGRYRAALAQRNGALRAGRLDVARAFDPALAVAGATIVATRLAWVKAVADRFPAELEAIGESAPVALAYEGRPELADLLAWEAALAAAAKTDAARKMTTIGPQRDDLCVTVGGRALRDYGSTGQQRSGAIALKLLELDTIGAARGTEPVLLLDDVFAELDRDRQRRLAHRVLSAGRQVLVTAPRRDELPRELDLPVWEVQAGVVSS
ncbi:MAG: DNA replication/repair protein RecF [Gemmatimonadota bacterium]